MKTIKRTRLSLSLFLFDNIYFSTHTLHTVDSNKTSYFFFLEFENTDVPVVKTIRPNCSVQEKSNSTLFFESIERIRNGNLNNSRRRDF